MADLEEIVENCRTREGDGSRNEDKMDMPRRENSKRKVSMKRRGSRGLQNPSQVSPEGSVPKKQWKSPQHADGPDKDKLPTQRDSQLEFYRNYQKVAEEYDRKFLKNRKEDLDTLLIFAGLFSAVAAAFITQADSQLQPDPGDETNALLRVLIYKIDNTTFGDDVPTLLQSPLPPIPKNLSQIILFLSLALALLCSSLAILCKHWLNRYASTEIEGSIIEHGHNRQGKLDSLYEWHFVDVIGYLQCMLQFSLFLFGCGLSVSFFGDLDLAAVAAIAAVIFIGILIFISISVVGVVSENCPYQTFASARYRGFWKRAGSIVCPRAGLELRSISWILHTSLDEAVRLSALKYLVSIPELPKFDPTVVADCFHVFVASINLSDDKVVIRKGLEHLATQSARCFFRTFHHLSITNPTSSVLEDLHRCYDRIFPPDADFTGLPFHHTMTVIHILIKKRLSPDAVEWDDDGLSTQERVPFAWYMAKAAEVAYEVMKRRKVPRWILRFAFESLSLHPPSPPPVIANCLEIIAIDLDCDVSNIATIDERVRVEQVSILIARKLESMVEATNPDQILSKRKAISALFPYAISLGRGRDYGMSDAILRTAVILYSKGLMWRRMEAMLLAESSSPSLNRAIVFVSPYLPWTDTFYDQNTVDRWAAAASAVQYSEEVGESVVDVLLQIASNSSLRPLIPDDVWGLLKKQVSLPPVCRGRSMGTGLGVFLHVRGRGDIDLLKSYYLLIWSEWDTLSDSVINEVETSIKEDFGGDGMRGHRKDLIERLNQVLGQLDRRPGYFDQKKQGISEDGIEQAKEQYTRLRDALLRIAMESLARPHSTSSCAMPLPCM